MPVLSSYKFQKTDFRGQTYYSNVHHGSGLWAYSASTNLTAHSTSALEREDREIVIDLVKQLNTREVLNLIDELLPGQVRRTSSVKAGWIPWKHVPYYSPRVRRNDLTLLVRLFFNFHIDTPWYCTDADGNISYYILFYLDSRKKLRAHVDGWSYHFDGGEPICKRKIKQELSKHVPAALRTVQRELDKRTNMFGFLKFDHLILLPGSGTTSGIGVVNVDEHVSLALLPSR